MSEVVDWSEVTVGNIAMVNSQTMIRQYRNGDETTWLDELSTINLRPLAQEMRDTGQTHFRDPITVEMVEKRVLDGHHRLLIAAALGWDVPVRFVRFKKAASDE